MGLLVSGRPLRHSATSQIRSLYAQIPQFKRNHAANLAGAVCRLAAEILGIVQNRFIGHYRRIIFRHSLNRQLPLQPDGWRQHQLLANFGFGVSRRRLRRQLDLPVTLLPGAGLSFQV